MKAQRRQKLLIPLNGILFIAILIQFITALSVTFGWGGSITYTFHTIGGYIVFGLIGFHIFLNGNWIGALLKRKGPKSEI
ncbi:MAG: hypothetical protein N2Z76_05835 [Treponemataceae bacterium]|nr:hypothetical protein [Treponemataceae bacterium]